MTSRGRKVLSQSPVVTALPKESQGIVYWHKKWSVSVSIRSIHCFTATLNARAARKSDGRKTVSVPAFPCLSLWERWPSAARTERGQITATSNRKMLAPSQADDVPRAQGSLSHLGDSSPKGRAKASYIGTRNGAYLYRYAPFTVLRLPLNARAARKSDGRKRFPSRHSLASLWERWPSAARTERANNGNVQSENAGTFAGR